MSTPTKKATKICPARWQAVAEQGSDAVTVNLKAKSMSRRRPDMMVHLGQNADDDISGNELGYQR